MEGSHHVNWNSIIYRKGIIHRTEIERPFLAGKGFNTNLVQFLLPYHVIISNVHVCSFACTISHLHGRAPKTVLRARNLVRQNRFIIKIQERIFDGSFLIRSQWQAYSSLYFQCHDNSTQCVFIFYPSLQKNVWVFGAWNIGEI